MKRYGYMRNYTCNRIRYGFTIYFFKIENKNRNLDEINHNINQVRKQKESTKVKIINENSPDIEYGSDSEILSSSNNSDENKSNNIYNIFITRGNNCKEEANKCNHEIKHD